MRVMAQNFLQNIAPEHSENKMFQVYLEQIPEPCKGLAF